jgi:outer membrane protein insertion porin family
MVGNTRTRDEVLRREMRQMEAGWFSTEQVNRSRDRLRRLGYFEDVTIETPAVPGSADQVDIDVKVKEKPSGNFLAGVGYSQSDGFILNTSLTQDNFLGTGKRVSLGFNTSSANTFYQLAFTNPYYTIDGISRGFNLSYRSTDYAELDVADYLTDTGQAGVNFGLPLSDLSRIGLNLDYNYTRLKLGSDPADELKDFVDDNGDRFNDFKLRSTWTYDSRDSAIFASRGLSHLLTGQITVPGSDLEWYKVSYRAVNYFEMSRYLTLMMRGELGYGNGYLDTNGLPFFYNFFAGGIGSVRGFKQNTLGPRDSQGDPIGGNLLVLGNVELLVPPPLEGLEKTVRISGFFDIGNVFDTEGLVKGGDYGFSVDELRYSVGVAGTWLSPVGALTVSLAYPLNTKGYDEKEYFQFSFGTGF